MPFQGDFMAENVKKLTVAQVIERRNANPNLLLLDVRTADEWEEHRIPGSLHIPMHSIVSRIAELDVEQETIVLCEHGIRSENVANYLAMQTNIQDISTMQGGLSEWTEQMESDD